MPYLQIDQKIVPPQDIFTPEELATGDALRTAARTAQKIAEPLQNFCRTANFLSSVLACGCHFFAKDYFGGRSSCVVEAFATAFFAYSLPKLLNTSKLLGIRDIDSSVRVGLSNLSVVQAVYAVAIVFSNFVLLNAFSYFAPNVNSLYPTLITRVAIGAFLYFKPAKIKINLGYHDLHPNEDQRLHAILHQLQNDLRRRARPRH